jgi:aminomethyltransferase
MGAKMVPFAGYSMPVQYASGVLKEHLHTRSSAGLFDVSHMGQVKVTGTAVAQALETVMPIDVQGLEVGRQRYGFLTNDHGGIIDDLMVTNCGDHFLLVLNAACKHSDIAYLESVLPSGVTLELMNDRALLALQGPKAREILQRLAPAVADMVFMDAAAVNIAGFECFVTCSGYTGEDGFEISVAADQAAILARKLLAEQGVDLVGLGARDSLRLEAGLCLYGHDLSEQTTPVAANLLWAISKVRRPGGERAGGYPGADVIAAQLKEGTAKKRIMLKPLGRAPVREGVAVVDENGRELGEVCSGGFGPTVEGPVAMAYVDSLALVNDTPLFALVRKKMIALEVVNGGPVPSRYFRG